MIQGVYWSVIERIQTVPGYWRKHVTLQSPQWYKMVLLRLKAINSVIEADSGAVKLSSKRDHVEGHARLAPEHGEP